MGRIICSFQVFWISSLQFVWLTNVGFSFCWIYIGRFWHRRNLRDFIFSKIFPSVNPFTRSWWRVLGHGGSAGGNNHIEVAENWDILNWHIKTKRESECASPKLKDLETVWGEASARSRLSIVGTLSFSCSWMRQMSKWLCLFWEVHFFIFSVLGALWFIL